MANVTAELTYLTHNKLFAHYICEINGVVANVQIERNKLDPYPPKVLQMSLMSLVPAKDVIDRR